VIDEVYWRANGWPVKLNPLIIARSQLLTAVDLFFADHDPVSVQALAGNAREVLEVLCRQGGIEPITELLLRDSPGKERRDVYAAANLYRNCFKHVGGTETTRIENQTILDQFDDTKNDPLLYLCIEDYVRLRKAAPIPFQVFQAWFCALHVELLHLNKVEIYSRTFPEIRTLPRDKQKELAAKQVVRCLSDQQLLSDPRTEPLQMVF
jgi:hypothetical protein